MGTSAAYGGSGGKDWTRLQSGLADWLDSLQPETDEPRPQDDDQAPDSEPSDDVQNEREPPVEQVDEQVVELLRPVAAALGWGSSLGGDGGGAPTGYAGGGRAGGGRSPGGGGRSRARAARVGGRLASGVAALRAADAEAMAELGLDLAELQQLGNAYLQSQRLLEAAVDGIPSSLEEDELRFAAARTAIWALQAEGEGPSVEEIIRYFVTEYVYEVVLTEGGPVLRSGGRDGTVAVGAEDRVHATIVALARSVEIRVEGGRHADLAAAVERVLEDTRRIIGTAG